MRDFLLIEFEFLSGGLQLLLLVEGVELGLVDG